MTELALQGSHVEKLLFGKIETLSEITVLTNITFQQMQSSGIIKSLCICSRTGVQKIKQALKNKNNKPLKAMHYSDFIMDTGVLRHDTKQSA